MHTWTRANAGLCYTNVNSNICYRARRSQLSSSHGNITETDDHGMARSEPTLRRLDAQWLSIRTDSLASQSATHKLEGIIRMRELMPFIQLYGCGFSDGTLHSENHMEVLFREETAGPPGTVSGCRTLLELHVSGTRQLDVAILNTFLYAMASPSFIYRHRRYPRPIEVGMCRWTVTSGVRAYVHEDEVLESLESHGHLTRANGTGTGTDDHKCDRQLYHPACIVGHVPWARGYSYHTTPSGWALRAKYGGITRQQLCDSISAILSPKPSLLKWVIMGELRGAAVSTTQLNQRRQRVARKNQHHARIASGKHSKVQPGPVPTMAAPIQPPMPPCQPPTALAGFVGSEYAKDGIPLLVYSTQSGRKICYYNTGDFKTSKFVVITGQPCQPIPGITGPLEVAADITGKLYVAVPEGRPLSHISKSCLGTYHYHHEDGDLQQIGTSCVVRRKLPAVRTSGHHSVVTTYCVFEPLYKSLVRKMMKVRVTEQLQQAASAYQQKVLSEVTVPETLGEVVRDLFSATTRAFLHMVDAQRADLRISNNGNLFEREVPLDVPREIEEFWHIRGQGCLTRGPWRVQPTDSHVGYELAPPVEFQVDGRFLESDIVMNDPSLLQPPLGPNATPVEIMRRRALQRAQDIGWPVGLPLFIARGTSKRDMTKYKWFSLSGHGIERLATSESTDNLLSGLKRLVGARDGELGLLDSEYKTQVSACNARSSTYYKVARSLRFTSAYVTRKNPRRYAPHLRIGDLGDYVRDLATDHMLAFINDRCNPGMVARWLRGAEKWVTAGGYELRKFSHMSVMDRAIWSEILGPNATPEKVRQLYSHLPGETKRQERIKFFRSIGVHLADDVIVQEAQVKMKLEETKVGKACRLFAPYAAGVLAAPHLAICVKGVMDGWSFIELGDQCGMQVYLFQCYYPSPDELTAAANFLHDFVTTYNNVFVALIHSDDFSFGVNVNGDWFITNADVSSMDTSQKILAHTLLAVAYDGVDSDFGLTPIRQALAGFVIRNPVEPDVKFKVYPNGVGNPTLGSGSTNTTTINTLLVCLLCIGLAGGFWREGVSTVEANELLVPQICAFFGYVVKVKSCYRRGVYEPALFEFLKHFYDKRNRCMVRMPTSYLKSLGGMFGSPYPARLGLTAGAYRSMSHGQLMHQFVSCVVKGLVHEPPHSIMQVLRERFNSSNAISIHYSGLLHDIPLVSSEKVTCYDSVQPHLIDLAIMDRYELTSSELAQIVAAIGSISVGEDARVLTKLLNEDYSCGLGFVDDDIWEYENPGTNNTFVA